MKTNRLFVSSTALRNGCLPFLFALAAAAAAMPDENSNSPTAVAAPSSGSSRAGETFTNESLATTLEDMGFEPKRSGNLSGYNISFLEGTLRVVVWVSVSGETHLRGTIFLETFEKDEAIPARVLLGLFDSNKREGFLKTYPTNDGKRHLFVETFIPNHHVTRIHLRNMIKGLTETAAATESLWNKAKWEPASGVAKK
jgi:hypothetical protein